jgi:hypothetical protein
LYPENAGRLDDLSATAALAAGLRLAAGRGTAAVTRFAGDTSAKGDGPFDACGSLLERERDVAADIGAASGASPSATASAKQVAEHPAAEQISKGFEDIFHVVELLAPAPHASVPVLIVAGAFFGVAEHIVRFARFFELLGVLFVALIAVGMVADRQLPIGAIDFGARRSPFDLQYFVVAAFFSHES